MKARIAVNNVTNKSNNQEPATPSTDVKMTKMTLVEANKCIQEINKGLSEISKRTYSLRLKVFDLYVREGWKIKGHRSWRECVTAEFGQHQSYLYRQLEAAKTEQVISPRGEKEIPEKVLRPLYKLRKFPELQREAYQEAKETASEGNVTAESVKTIVSEKCVKLGKTSSPRRRQPPHENVNQAPEVKSTEMHADTTTDQTVEETSTPHHQVPPSEEIASAPDGPITQEHVEENEDKTLLPPTHATPEPNREPETDTPPTRLTAMECAERAIRELKMINLNDPMRERAFNRVREHMDKITRLKAA